MDNLLYQTRVTKYMKTLKTCQIINKKIKKDTLTSILNENARFLYIPCPNCSVTLVDTIGDMKTAKCGNCGYYKILTLDF